MAVTTISPKFQIVIPKDVREKLHLSPQQRLQVVEKGGIIFLVPEVPLKNLRGPSRDCLKPTFGRKKTSHKVGVDSSGWIEFFTGGPLAERYAAYFAPRYDRIVPTIVLYEVYKKIKRERGEETALLFSGQIGTHAIVPLSDSIAYLAADISLLHGLAMADAIVYATARDQDAQVVTGDTDLKDLPGLIYIS